jgi:universal stress protein A
MSGQLNCLIEGGVVMNAFQNVVIGMDLSEANAKRLLSRACQLTDPENIEVIHACSNLHHEHEEYTQGAFSSSEELDAAVISEAEHFLCDVCQPLGIERHKVLDGRVTTALHDYAGENSDLVVIGSHGRHGLELLFGSKSNEVVHITPCDVLAVHLPGPGEEAGECGGYKRVLAAIDLSAESTQVIDHALRVADACGAELKLCHVSKHLFEAGKQEDRERLAKFAEDYDLSAEDIHELSGRTAHAIHNLAKEIGADLLVAGIHNFHGDEFITGSTANAVLHGAKCDALSVHVQPAA